MKKEFQMAVVGAGPAGSTAAEVAAAQGVEVVLIERKSEIGTPVQCGGFLPEAPELKELMPRAYLPAALKDVPGHCILNRTCLQRIYAPSGKSKEFHVSGRILDRRAFDRHLAYRAARSGTKILPATRAILVQNELLLSGRSSGSIKSQVIVGADGPLSSVSRSMGNPKGEVGICIEYEMVDVDIDSKTAEMYFSAHYAPGGYAWIIPLGRDIANVGIGVRSSYIGKGKLSQLLDGFIEEHPVAAEKLKRGEVLAVMRGLVPVGGSPGKIQMQNMLLAGDSAGHVMATSGGGIPLAMVAGRIAGEVATGYLRGEIRLQEYQSRIREEFGKELERSVQIRKMVDVAMRSDKLMDALFSALGPDQLKSIMRAQISALLGLNRELVTDMPTREQ